MLGTSTPTCGTLGWWRAHDVIDLVTDLVHLSLEFFPGLLISIHVFAGIKFPGALDDPPINSVPRWLVQWHLNSHLLSSAKQVGNAPRLSHKSAAKKSPYQSKVFVCVSVIGGMDAVDLLFKFQSNFPQITKMAISLLIIVRFSKFEICHARGFGADQTNVTMTSHVTSHVTSRARWRHARDSREWWRHG